VTLFYFIPDAPLPGPIDDAAYSDTPFRRILSRIQSAYSEEKSFAARLNKTLEEYRKLGVTRVPVDPFDWKFLEGVVEELRVQKSLEERWQKLVSTISPEAANQEPMFRLLKLIIEQARYDAEHLPRRPTTTPPFLLDETRRIALPPQFEQSLAEIVSNTHR
jgi:hypothetical protein